MRTAAVVLAALLTVSGCLNVWQYSHRELTGCREKQKPLVLTDGLAVFNPPPTREARVYAELWRIAKERHLTYRVAKSEPLFNRKHYLASAHRDGNWWFGHGFGPTEAAEELIEKLRQDYGFDTGDVQP